MTDIRCSSNLAPKISGSMFEKPYQFGGFNGMKIFLSITLSTVYCLLTIYIYIYIYIHIYIYTYIYIYNNCFRKRKKEKIELIYDY